MTVSYDQVVQWINGAQGANAQGNHALAVTWCEQALAAAPAIPDAWYNYGIALGRLGRVAQAVDALKQAEALTLDSADAQNSVGLELLELDAQADAQRCFERAIARDPGHPFPYCNLGKLFEQQKRYQDAESAFRKAIELQPDLAPAYANLCGILNVQRQYAAARAIGRRAVELDPGVFQSWNNLGIALAGLKDYPASIDAYQRAVALSPGAAEAWSNLASSLSKAGQHDAAVSAFERAFAIDPDAKFLFGDLVYEKARICDWRTVADDLPRLLGEIERGALAATPFVTLLCTDSLRVQRQAATAYARDLHPARTPLGELAPRPRRDKIRIGYYSADFRNHPVAHLIAELFERHDKSRFELVGFSLSPERDAMSARLEAAFDTFIDVSARDDEAVAALSRQLEIDVAIDLGGYTEDARPGVFARRVAPVQAGFLGYAGTLGADYIDYIIADRTVIPVASRAHYAEKVVSLPACYMVNDSTRPIAERVFSREELGLPDRAFVFCCFNNAYKITPEVFDGWMRILGQVEGSVLWLSAMNPAAAANLRQAAATRGIEPQRLVFAPRLDAISEHLARHRAADLFLDTTPYNAHATTSDALWSGLPVLTRPGASFASRVAASLLNAIGLPELVTNSPAEYEALAVELATHPEKLAQLKRRLDQNRLSAPLFDTARFTRHIEAAYSAMVERHRAGLPPDHLDVDA